MDKLKTYQDALTEVIAELRQKRTELATAAKAKLEDLQKEIPELEKAISEKRNKILELDKALMEREDKAKVEEINWKARYDKLSENLKNQADEKQKELDKLIAEAKFRNNQFNVGKKEQEESLKNKENALISKESKLLVFEDHLNKTEATLRSEANSFAEYKKKERANIEDLRVNFQTKVNNAEEKIKEATDKLKEAYAKEAQVDAVLARIKEVEGRESAVARRENESAQREANLNSIAVENIAERKRLNKYKGELDELKTKLDKRESNLKLLEEKAIKEN